MRRVFWNLMLDDSLMAAPLRRRPSILRRWMTRVLSTCVAALALLAWTSEQANAWTLGVGAVVDGRVVGISDGDTLTLLDAAKRQHRVRLANIDAPESSQAFGQRSKQSLSDLCFGRAARINVVDIDTQYNRVVADVFCTNPQGLLVHANHEQVRAGMAWAYRRYLRDANVIALERQASERRLGLWSESNPVPPWDYRKASKESHQGVGNANAGTARALSQLAMLTGLR